MWLKHLVADGAPCMYFQGSVLYRMAGDSSNINPYSRNQRCFVGAGLLSLPPIERALARVCHVVSTVLSSFIFI